MSSKKTDYTKRERATIITQTPMRIPLAGGGTDVLWYSKLKGGAWISAGINKYVFCFLNKTEDPNFIKASHGSEATMDYNYKKIPNPIIRECLKLSGITKGIEISTAADASAKSGLGGSGAFEVGLLHALYVYKRQPLSQVALAKKACKIEIDILEKPVGPQDQYIAALGGINYFEIDRSGRVSMQPLRLSNHTIAELESNLLFFRTGIQHDTGKIHGLAKEQMEKKNDDSEKIIKALDCIKDLGKLAKEYLEKSRLDDFGSTLHEHWLIKKKMSNAISTPKIDIWYDEAIKAGALGGKIMGAGGGGWFVFYVNKNKDTFRRRMEEVGLEERRVRFDWEGTKVLVNLS